MSYAVGCCIVDGWVDHWCTDVSWVWRIPNRNAAVSHTTTTYATTSYYTTKAREYYTTTSDAPSCYTEASKYNSALSHITREPEYYTEAPKYYITKAPEYYTSMYAAPAYYTESPNYYNTEVRISDTERSVVAYRLSVTNCNLHRVTSSQLWVNIQFFTMNFVSILFFLLLICLLFNINVN
jgi:hypothetical protein